MVFLMAGDLLPWLGAFEDLLWKFFCVPLFLFMGIYLSWKGRLLQVRAFPRAIATFFTMLRTHEKKDNDVHPLKAFFTCVGGCIGIGNIVGVCTAIQIGGPGALFWVWVTAVLGTILKYSEVYLGMRFRVKSSDGSFNGGPMYFLRHAFSSSFFPSSVALLLCLYGVEVFQFNVVTTSFIQNFNVNPFIVVPLFLALVLLACSGGIHRVGAIASIIVPLFTLIYLVMGLWVIFMNFSAIPAILSEVFFTAFSPAAAAGGLLGASLMTTISQGIRRGCYTSDFGVGYASVIHSTSMEEKAEKQASLVFIDTFLDTFVICTTTIMLILITGVWKEQASSALLVQNALAGFFPYMEYFIPLFLFLLGYSTINAYFCVGLQCAESLSPRYGRQLFFIYGSTTLLFFSFFDSMVAQSVMQIVGGLLLLINGIGMLKLLNHLSFAMPQAAPAAPMPMPMPARTSLSDLRGY